MRKIYKRHMNATISLHMRVRPRRYRRRELTLTPVVDDLTPNFHQIYHGKHFLIDLHNYSGEFRQSSIGRYAVNSSCAAWTVKDNCRDVIAAWSKRYKDGDETGNVGPCTRFVDRRHRKRTGSGGNIPLNQHVLATKLYRNATCKCCLTITCAGLVTTVCN